MTRTRYSSALAWVALVLVAGCGSETDPASEGPVEWTFLWFMNGDNNLEGAALRNINELETVGGTPRMNLVVQIDRSASYDATDGDWTGARRYVIEQDGDSEAIRSTVAQDLGEVAMNDPAVLEDFLSWGMSAYPANRFGLVIWDHGGGFKVLSVDDSEQGAAATPAEFAFAIRNALAGAGRERLDLMAFDMCLMGMIEVDLELADIAKVRVASEELVPGRGLDYATTFGAVAAEPTMGEAAVGERLVRDFEAMHVKLGDGADTTFAAIDLGQFPSLLGAIGGWIEVLGPRMPALWPAFGRAMTYAEAYGDKPSISSLGTGFIDLGHLVSITGELGGDPDVQAAGNALLAAIDGASIARTAGADRPHARGISVFNVMPRIVAAAKGDPQAYADGEAWYATRFPVESRWDVLMSAFSDGYLGSPPLLATITGLSSDTVKQITGPEVQDGDGIVVDGRIDGQGLSSATIEVFAYYDQKLILLSQRSISVPTRTLTDGTVVPDVAEDVNVFSAEWFPLGMMIGVGDGIVVNATFIPGTDGGELAVPVQYDVAASGKSFEGTMLFRPAVPAYPEAGGDFLRLFLYQDSPKGRLAAEYPPMAGDLLRGRVMYYGDPPDFTASWDGHQFLLEPATPVALVDGAPPLVFIPFAPADLYITYRATDVVGFYDHPDPQPISVIP